MTEDKPNIHGAKDLISDLAFGKTITAAHDEQVCVSCHDSIRDIKARIAWGKIDDEEYRLSGLCPECFEEITGNDTP